MFAFEVGEDLGVEGTEAVLVFVNVAYQYDNLRLVHGTEAPLNAKGFDGVCGVPDAGGVDEAESDSVQVYRVFYYIACGAVDVAHDGTLFTHQGIEQGGFARIGLSDDGYGDAKV